jgi:enamine deaminase RidA (YjgF/YER057c/UK114 family)
VRERAHRHCTALITAQHDAVVQGAMAHHGTRQDLAEARAQSERLEQELASVRQRAEQAEAAYGAVERLLAEPLPLTRPRLENQGPTDAALTNVVLMRILLRNEANLPEHRGSYYAAHLHDLADALQARIVAAFEGDPDPERELALLQAPLVVPVPRGVRELGAAVIDDEAEVRR